DLLCDGQRLAGGELHPAHVDQICAGFRSGDASGDRSVESPGAALVEEGVAGAVHDHHDEHALGRVRQGPGPRRSRGGPRVDWVFSQAVACVGGYSGKSRRRARRTLVVRAVHGPFLRGSGWWSTMSSSAPACTTLWVDPAPHNLKSGPPPVGTSSTWRKST